MQNQQEKYYVPSPHNITVEELQHWLCSFILEVWKKDGNVFVPNRLHHICCGIMRYIFTNKWNYLQTNGMPVIKVYDPGYSCQGE